MLDPVLVDAFYQALGFVFSPFGLLAMFIGSVIGITIGALPGLSAVMAVAILVPFTFNLDPHYGLMLLLGIYGGAMFGGSVSAILINVPGTPAAIMTTMDGYPMAQKGEAGRAIGIALWASFFGGIFSSIVLVIFAPILAAFALKFSAAEYFSLAVFGLAGIVSATSDSKIKGIAMVFLGLFVSMVGMDPMTGVTRFTFGSREMLSGIRFVPAMIGVYGLGEILMQIHKSEYVQPIRQKVTNAFPSWKEIREMFRPCMRGSIVGSVIGTLPGEGATVAAFIAYNDTKKFSKNPEKFGHGSVEGLAACESANNAVCGGSLIPTLTLGIPGSGVMAVIMGALMMHNITPGPMLFAKQPDIVMAIFICLFINNFFMLFIGMTGSRYFAKLISIPQRLLMPAIIVLCSVGAFAVSNSLWDFKVMVAFGFLGYLFRIFKFPIPPMILGIVLGPLAEVNLRKALLISHGSPDIFFTRPISLTILVLTALYIFWPYLKNGIARLRKG